MCVVKDFHTNVLNYSEKTLQIVPWSTKLTRTLFTVCAGIGDLDLEQQK